VVEDSPELAGFQSRENRESEKITTKLYAPRYTWFEHLLGLFCINVAARKEPIVRVEQKLVLLEDPVMEEVGHHHSIYSWQYGPSLTFARIAWHGVRHALDITSLRTVQQTEYGQDSCPKGGKMHH
jgi:hypothetical protein